MVVLLAGTALLLGTPVAGKSLGEMPDGERDCSECYAETARRLNNNNDSNNPRCGTDRLRDAW
ncbi:hypothetical protein MPRM_46150 [Mycobacterium parmense]|uniref:Uncharacterized protein n=1 Tax=Mycobacterium parmense TaxID=185642 RepID=A0A7I7Z262_9MYCO|nr:hypothetical protein MPRM_46150 [Mycobacterium parmense]